MPSNYRSKILIIIWTTTKMKSELLQESTGNTEYLIFSFEQTRAVSILLLNGEHPYTYLSQLHIHVLILSRFIRHVINIAPLYLLRGDERINRESRYIKHHIINGPHLLHLGQYPVRLDPEPKPYKTHR